MKNAQRKLIPAIAMLLVAVMTLSGATYAWFTMSRTVTAEGIQLTAIAPTNLLISNAVDGTYAETTTVTETFGEGKLMPASTMSGANGTIFAAQNIKAAQNGAPDATTNFVAATTALATDTDGYYADFKLWLKTTGEDDVDVTISQLAALTFMDGSSENIKDAARFAVLQPDGTMFAGTKNVYAFDADFFATLAGPIVSAGLGGDTDPATSAERFKGQADANITDGTTIFTVAGGDQGEDNTPTAIIVRVWIEGQDLECVSANAAQSFEMQVGFSDVLYTPGIA